MVRRRSPPPVPPIPDPLPEGWNAHDGSAMPVEPDSMPAVWLRSGTQMQPGMRSAADWEGWAGRKNGSCWVWEGSGFDILAWKLHK
ncbi:hypothetical protein [Qipengyuania citrea]|uniref:hypothetical protein n=1 Tax=Qipengyuania citrea TaxID=225971 RepID=UPI0012EDF406|nr:hypothetical protein [Qipengyuania citrea]